MEDLTKQYPNIIKKCREWDCSFTEAIERFKNPIIKQKTLKEI